ncbi:Abhydrolase domain-containing protein [Vanrija pseudolonga]|uniref:Abhydrolase domain-containing protein n=1 Tax=Vanrija pseudolonga TaxID=143232 RepID=A0AAF0Y4C1_9TREE|nr:Abhydrolase domain-containing protein [Vanrija pseudolonga]WOO80058.1 Abhydrolase domain-containing protein [Vanrija pseudolonga]
MTRPTISRIARLAGLGARALATSAPARAWGPRATAVELSYDTAVPRAPSAPGHAMVICHGLFGSKANWRGLATRFADNLGMTVYTLDLRNHGRSPHATPHTSQAMAEDIAAFIGSQSASRIHLVGHSMGAKAVMALALNAELNAKLHTLTAVDMAPASEPIEPQYKGYAEAMMAIAAAGVSKRAEADAMLAPYEPVASTRQFLLTNAVSVKRADGKTVLGFRVNLPVLHDAIDGLGEFMYDASEPSHPTWDGPTLFLYGRNADYVRDDNLPAARAFFPRLEAVGVDAGHWVHADQPDETVRVISQFVKAHLES